MLKKPPILDELMKGGARLRTGVALLGWGFSASMALLVAISAYQNKAPDPFSQPYAAMVLPDVGEVTSTASIGKRARPTEFGVFSNPTPVQGGRPGRFEAEIETLRHEIVALRRSADALRRQNDFMSDRIASLESGNGVASARPSSAMRAQPLRYARAHSGTGTTHIATASPAIDTITTGSIRRPEPLTSAGRPTTAPRSQFGIDLGAYGSLAEVANAWRAMRVTESSVIGPLSPLASIIERGDKMVAHLVAGPFDNAADAAAACARLEKRLIACQPTLFTGQQLPPR
ncbi:SPOR domain-containing protein [Breoghania sp.]|uniref:SPOR domain-containing protein n=1 Tax=Breoghania sp. TaxID=2065378 RepID=UPI002AABB49B|nr:SPOR domain-containing protein [Breoghania sp.]